MATATASVMAQPTSSRRVPPPPPPAAGGRPNRPPPRRPPAPSRPPPPPVAGSKRPADSSGDRGGSRKQSQRMPSVSIMAPVVMRDVTVFQKKNQVGQGTYGSVFMGADKKTGDIVALKRINTEQEANGFPITAIREVKILKALKHPNIVELKEIVTSKDNNTIPKNVFMVFEYLEYDLTGVLETPEIKLTQDHVKSWSQQLLAGVHYMHTNKIIHRDLKASNLLINKKGELKIADWGLARSWNSEMKRLTNCVITLWYRPPELLLGCTEYTTKIDMWSVGCIIAEMFRRSGFLKGSNETSQLELIFRTMGHPKLSEWPNIHKLCPLWKNYEPKAGETPFPRKIRESLEKHCSNPSWITENAEHLIDMLLVHNPDVRWSALEALDAEYFFENPIVKPANKLKMDLGVESVHEWEARKKHEKAIADRKEKAQGASSSHRQSGSSNRQGAPHNNRQGGFSNRQGGGRHFGGRGPGNGGRGRHHSGPRPPPPRGAPPSHARGRGGRGNSRGPPYR